MDRFFGVGNDIVRYQSRRAGRIVGLRHREKTGLRERRASQALQFTERVLDVTGIETADGAASCAADGCASVDTLAFSKDILAAVDLVSSDVDDLIEAVNVDVDFDPDNAEDGDTDADSDFDIDDDVFAIIDIDIDIDPVAERDDITDIDTDAPLETRKRSDAQDLAPEGRPVASSGEPAWLP